MLTLFLVPTLSISHEDRGTKPLLGTFYYPWYKSSNGEYNVWNRDGHDPPNTWASNYLPDISFNKYDPISELYDSNDPLVIDKQVSWMERAGIQFVISSWWGKDSFSDHAFFNILNVILPSLGDDHSSLKWTLLYEEEGSANPSIEKIISDLQYIKSQYTDLPMYLKIDGKPVIFVYNADHKGFDPADELSRWSRAQQETGFYLIMKVNKLSYTSHNNSVDSWFEYNPKKTYDQQANFSASVSPGYWKYDDTPDLPRNLSRFEEGIRDLAQADVPLKLIVTWNEWLEGTGVEPAQEIIHNDSQAFVSNQASYKEQYIEAIAKYFR